MDSLSDIEEKHIKQLQRISAPIRPCGSRSHHQPHARVHHENVNGKRKYKWVLCEGK